MSEYSGQRALVIDDSGATRRVLRELLEKMGFAVTEKEDAKGVLPYLEKEISQTDIIFSDINMPGMSGYEFCSLLNEASWYDETPLVIGSTNSDAGSVVKALKLGADDYLPKPFQEESLNQVVRRVLQ